MARSYSQKLCNRSRKMAQKRGPVSCRTRPRSLDLSDFHLAYLSIFRAALSSVFTVLYVFNFLTCFTLPFIELSLVGLTLDFGWAIWPVKSQPFIELSLVGLTLDLGWAIWPVKSQPFIELSLVGLTLDLGPG